MRRLIVADGRGTVTVQRGRAEVRYDGRYLGRAVRYDGLWCTPAQAPHPSPGDAAEDMIHSVLIDQAA